MTNLITFTHHMEGRGELISVVRGGDWDIAVGGGGELGISVLRGELDILFVF